MTISRRRATLAAAAALSMPLRFAMAQDASPEVAEGDGSAFAFGLNVAATMYDERGNPTSTLAVTQLDVDWDGYDAGMGPDAGKMYVAVTFAFTNLANRPSQVEPYQFQLIDNFGMLAQQGYMWNNDEFDEQTVAVDPGATGEIRLLYVAWSDSQPLMVVHQGSYNMWSMIYVGESE